MKLSDYIADYLAQKGIKVVFGYIGGMITHLVDSITRHEKLIFVQTYHEQTAAIAAEGYAKESGLFGVAISTSGPGATNMITGIADAYFDSIPVLYITGQVNTYEYKYDKPVRQQGFQETDVVSIVTPVTKYAKLIDNAEDIRYELDKALCIALSGRKGPVLLDLPMDIQRTEINPDELEGYTPVPAQKTIPDFSGCKELLRHANRPMLLLGAGCAGKDTFDLLNHFIAETNIPVVTSLMGRGTYHETYKNYIGMIGSYGNRCANMGIANADLLIVLGSRLDTRQTGACIDTFLKNGHIIHVDVDENELEYHRLDHRVKINCDVNVFLCSMLSDTLNCKDYTVWNTYLMNLKQKYNQSQEIDRFVENKSPYRFMQVLNRYTKEGDIICADIGQNQMWAAQTLSLKKDQKFITSGGLAPMGFSLPVAIGASFASPGKPVISISGDGGFHMALQSLMLIYQYDLPIKVIVLNNQALGMITQFQHLYFDDRMAATTAEGGYKVPKIESLASAYRLLYYRLTEKDLKNDELLANIFSNKNCIVEYVIEGKTTVSPKLEYNKPIEMPLPLLPEEELKNSLLNR